MVVISRFYLLTANRCDSVTSPGPHCVIFGGRRYLHYWKHTYGRFHCEKQWGW